MYSISDAQIEYILSDIRRNGVDMEDLQFNLLDHICCIIERELKDDGDFEHFYHATVKQFYKKELREIEEETIQLLTFKNYYAMKKFMFISGAASVVFFIIGSFLKIMHWPGAGVMLISGILLFCFLFLPLVLLLKLKEASNQRDKWVLAVGIVVGILYCLSTLFLIQHWPGSRMIWLTTLSLSFFVLVPLYFFTGIRKPETKVNTIVTTVLLMGFLGLEFTITAIRTTPQTASRVYTYLQSEELLDQAQADTTATAGKTQAIQAICERMKSYIREKDVALAAISSDFESNGVIVREKSTNVLVETKEGQQLLSELKKEVETYNAQTSNKIPLHYSVLDTKFISKNFCSNLFVLNNITQLQLFLANAHTSITAAH